MALDLPSAMYLEGVSWNLVCLTIGQYPQGSCLLEVENPTMVNITIHFFVILQGLNILFFSLSVLNCKCV